MEFHNQENGFLGWEFLRVREDTPSYMLKYSHLDYSSKEYKQAYRKESKRNPKTWLTKTYGRMKRDNKNKFGKDLPFSKNEFAEWVFEKNNTSFEVLFKDYIDSDFDKNLNPSIDRIDDYDSYKFSNMQLITWYQNNKKGRESAKNKQQCSDMAKAYWSKPVNQYDINGNFIQEYYSAREAGRCLNVDSSGISKVCRDGKGIYKGFIWRYKNE